MGFVLGTLGQVAGLRRLNKLPARSQLNHLCK